MILDKQAQFNQMLATTPRMGAELNAETQMIVDLQRQRQTMQQFAAGSYFQTWENSCVSQVVAPKVSIVSRFGHNGGDQAELVFGNEWCAEEVGRPAAQPELTFSCEGFICEELVLS